MRYKYLTVLNFFSPKFVLTLGIDCFLQACANSEETYVLGAFVNDAVASRDATQKQDAAQTADSQIMDGSAGDTYVEVIRHVIYNTNGGTLAGQASADVADGKTIPTPPPSPSREHYIFTTWYTEADSSNQNESTRFKFENEGASVTPSVVTKDTVLYAGWKQFSLRDVTKEGHLPIALDLYDDVARTTLSPFKTQAASGANVSTIYVTMNGGTDLNKRDGLSWDTAWSSAQLKEKLDAINDASEKKIYLFLVAAGEYQVDSSLSMKNYVAIVGGWEGPGSWKRSPEDATFVTNFKGGKDKNQSFSVFDHHNITDKAILAYATISYGKSPSYAGGMRNISSSPSLMNVTFTNNEGREGGAMHNYLSSPSLLNVTFMNNVSLGGGGAMYNNKSAPTLINVTMTSNSSFSNGAMYNYDSSPTLVNVAIVKNQSNSSTSGMLNDRTSSTVSPDRLLVVNSIFWGNTITDPNAEFKDSQILLFNYKDRVDVPENITLYNSIVQGGLGAGDLTSAVLSLETLANSTNKKRFGGIAVYDPDRSTGSSVSITFENVYGANTAEDPNLSELKNHGGTVQTVAFGAGSFAINKGLYVRLDSGIYYYSEDNSNWFIHPTPSTKNLSFFPVSAFDLTAVDARGYARVGKPDIGAYEYGASPP